MNVLPAIDDLGLRPNWLTVHLAIGEPGNPGVTSTQEAIDFAVRRIVEGSDDSLVSELSGLSAGDDETIRTLVADLASKERTSNDHESRKLVLALLVEQLRTLPDEPLHAILALGEFWSEHGTIERSPYATTLPTGTLDDYDAAALSTMLAAHNKWIERERRDLIESENDDAP